MNIREKGATKTRLYIKRGVRGLWIVIDSAGQFVRDATPQDVYEFPHWQSYWEATQ